VKSAKVSYRKRLIGAISILAFVTSVSPPAAADDLKIPCGATSFYNLILPSGVVQGGQKCEGSVNIDSRAKVIGKDAFAGSRIKDVNIPNTVTTIESGAFAYTNLTSINIGNAVDTIGFEAFRGSKFQKILLPISLKYIGESSFADTYFTNITIPNSVLSIGPTAFAREDSGATLEEIFLPASVRSIGYAAFVRAGLQRVVIGSGIETIPASAFEGNQIREVIIPKNVKYIQAFAFRRNPLDSITFSEGLQLVDSEAFAYTNVVKLSLPTTLTQIGTRAFANNTRLKELDISDFYEGSIAVDGTQTVGDVFAEDYSIQKIAYCGKITGFYVSPTCEGARKVNASERTTVESQRAVEEERQRQEAQITFEKEQERNIADAIKKAATSDAPITIKVTGQIPNCPGDFQQVMELKPVRSARGLTIFCKSIVKPEAERSEAAQKQKLEQEKASATDTKPQEPKTSQTSDASQVVGPPKPSLRSSSIKKSSTTCIKGKARKIVTGINPKCPKGYAPKK